MTQSDKQNKQLLRNTTALTVGRLGSKVLVFLLVRFYKKFISPILPGSCRFTPTCSAYALEAFTKRGFFVGTVLTVWRILRCNPFCPGGYDPVPERRPRRIKNNEKRTEKNDTMDEQPNIIGEDPAAAHACDTDAGKN